MKGRGLRILAIVLGVVVAIVVVLSLVLDSVITSRARAEADALSRQWGRPVRIDSVATKIFTGLGVRVSGVQIGPAEGEKLPLLDVPRVEVKMALLRAALSRGKEIEIRSAEVEGLTLNIVRFP